MKQKATKTLALLLTLVMLLSLFPATALTAYAEYICPLCSSTNIEYDEDEDEWFCYGCWMPFDTPAWREGSQSVCPHCGSTDYEEVGDDDYYCNNCGDWFVAPVEELADDPSRIGSVYHSGDTLPKAFYYDDDDWEAVFLKQELAIYALRGCLVDVDEEAFIFPYKTNHCLYFRPYEAARATDAVTAVKISSGGGSRENPYQLTPQYPVSFNANGGSPAPSAQQVWRGDKVTAPAAPTREGCEFAGWFNGNTQWDFNQNSVDYPITLTAHWNVPVTSVSLPDTATLTVDGEAVALTATVEPAEATDKTVKWSTTGGVTLYSDGNCTADNEIGADATSTLIVYAKGITAGDATVTVTSNADSTKTATCAVTVTAPAPAHTHSFTYAAGTGDKANTITASCGEGCDITEGLTLTISAPEGDLTADGSKTFPATLNDDYNPTAFPEGSISEISYTKDGAAFDGTPTEAGAYVASVTVGDATASVSYTVNAAQTQTETLLTTITATGTEQASYSTANVATVSFSNLPDIGSSYTAIWGWWGYGWTATVNAAEGYTITKCVFYDDKDRTATDSEAPFVVETTEEDKTPKVNGTILAGQSKGIKKIEVYGYATPAHTHEFTYSADGATITATCGEGCDITEGLTLTISAPTGDLTADGTKTFPAALSTGYNPTAFPEGSISEISYTKDGAAFTGTPTEAGAYVASVTVGDATASVSYTVNAADTTVTWTSSQIRNIRIDAHEGMAYNNTISGITVTGSGETAAWMGDIIDFGPDGSFTFTSSVGNISSIVISANTRMVEAQYLSSGWSKTSSGLSWSGTAAASVTLSAQFSSLEDISQIVFTKASAHTHSFTYTAGTGDKANTITASCGTGCNITEGLTLTISAPEGDLTADGTKTFPAALSTGYNPTAFPEGSISEISYTKDGAAFTGTPTEAGAYVASVTVGDATATVSYTVNAAADPDQEAADAVTNTISALPAAANITLENAQAVNDAKAAYDALTDDQKALVPADTVNKLNAAVAKIADLTAANTVSGTISALPAAADITLDNAQAVADAKAAYDVLTDDQKALVPADTVNKLNAAVAKIADLTAANTVSGTISALPAAADITLDNAQAVADAKAAYDALTDDQKALVPADTVNKLNAAVAKIADLTAANTVSGTISALPAAADITLDNAQAVAAAKAAYDALTDDQKALVPADTVNKLNAAVAKIADLTAANTVSGTISALPAAADITLDNAQAVADAKAAYDALTDDQKALVPANTVNKLNAAVAKIADLTAANTVSGTISALPAAADITLDNAQAVAAAKAAYDALTDDQKALVPANTVNKLNAAVAKIADLTAANTVSGTISALPAAADITLDNAQAVAAAKAAYDALTDDQKALVPADTVNKLNAAVAKIADLTAANTVSGTISALPDFSNVTTDNRAAIEAARAAYNALTADQKALVSAVTLKKLTDAEDKLVIIQVMSEVSAKTGSGMTYTGSPIQLVNPPTTALPAGYTMKYAVTTENTAPANSLYTTDNYTATNAGTCYVWYKVVGDENHNDSDAACVSVSIAKAAAPGVDELTEDQQPTAAEELVADGTQQQLVSAPAQLPEGYSEVQYSIDNGENWSSTIPTAADAGEYSVLVKYVGDGNHEDFFGETLSVSIRQLTVSFDENGGSEVDDQLLNRGQTAVRPEDPTRVGFRFIDWYADEACTELFDFSTTIQNDTVIYALWEPIMLPETLNLKQEYLLLKPAQSFSLTVLGVPAEWLGGIEWSSDDESVATVNAGGKVSAVAKGTAWVTATLDSESSALTARCRIDVADDLAEVTDVRLVDTKATTELYSTDYARVQVLPELSQNQSNAQADSADKTSGSFTAVESARFADAAADAVFELRPVDDRTLEIVPKAEFVHGDAAKLKTLKTSYKSAVTVTIGGQEFTTPETVTISVKKTQPRLTAKINKFNSFIPGDAQFIVFTGGVPENVSVASAPDWVEVEPETLFASYTGAYDANKNGKLVLNVKPVDWDLTVPVTVNVSAGKTAPRLTLTPATVNLKPDVDEIVYSDAAFTLVDPDFWSIGTVSVTEGKNNADSAIDVSFEGTSINVRPGPDAPNDGKAHTYKVTVALLRDGVPSSVTAALTVKLLASTDKVSVTAKVAGNIDTAIPKSPVTITLTPKNASNHSVDVTEVTVSGVKGREAPVDVTESFDVAIDGLTVTLTQAEGAVLDKSLSYTATVKTNVGAEATARVTVKTGVSVKPAVTLKVAGFIDVIRPDSCITVTPTIKNCYTHVLSEDDLQVWQLAKVSGRSDYVPAGDKFDVNLVGDTFVVTLKPDSGVDHTKDKFAISFKATMDGVAVETTKTNISVRMGTAKLTQSTKSVTLLKDDRNSRGTVTLSVAEFGVNEIDWVKTLGAVVVPVGRDKLPLFTVERSANDLMIGYAHNEIKSFNSASVKIPVFLKGNNSTNPNTTFYVSVKVG